MGDCVLYVSMEENGVVRLASVLTQGRLWHTRGMFIKEIGLHSCIYRGGTELYVLFYVVNDLRNVYTMTYVGNAMIDVYGEPLLVNCDY